MREFIPLCQTLIGDIDNWNPVIDYFVLRQYSFSWFPGPLSKFNFHEFLKILYKSVCGN